MARIALSAALLSLVLASTSVALAIEERDSSIFKAKLVKVSTISNASNIVAQDNARLRKFQANPKSASKAAATTGTGTAINEVFIYIAKTLVGDQTFDLIVDTGSSNTWVGAQTPFQAGSTGKPTGQTVQVTYGSGSFSGNEYTDTVSIGGNTVTAQSIGVATSSTGFRDVDGIVGFGPEELTEGTVSNTNEVPTFMQNLVSQNVIRKNILGVHFAPPGGSSSSSANGELTFGGVDSSKYIGSISYTQRVAPYWGVNANNFQYGSLPLTNVGGASGIVDTGTTLFYIPTVIFNQFLAVSKGFKDPGSGLVKYIKAPKRNFSFFIGGTTYTLTPQQYLIPAAQYGNWGLTPGSGYYTFIGDGGVESPNMILGMSFLDFYYSVYDTTNNRVGLARAA